MIKDGRVIATDAHKLIFADVDIIGEMPIAVETERSLKKIIEGENNFDLSFDPKELLSKISMPLVEEYKSIGEDVQCDECKGEGIVEWEYDTSARTYHEEFDCPICEGEGLSEKKRSVKTGRHIPDPNAKLLFQGVLFAYSVFESLASVSEATGVKMAKWIRRGELSGNLFSFGEFGVVLAPMPMKGDEECIHLDPVMSAVLKNAS